MTYNFKAIANEITERGINLFGNEDDWFKGSMALSNLGDDGKEIFHTISSLSPVYNYRDSEYQFNYAARTNTKIGIATFLQMVKNAGIDIKRFKIDGDDVPDNRLLKPTPTPPAPPSYIPKEYLIRSLSLNSTFIEYLYKLFDIKTIEHIAAEYYLGTTKSRGVIYWQVDINRRIRTGKVMLYDPQTGHRVQTGKATTWVHSLMLQQGLIKGKFNLCQCLFGEHLLQKYPDKTVAIVEAEKTAVIASAVFPGCVWLATGGKYFNIDKMKVLAGRKVILFPDTDPTGETYNYWKEKASELTNCTCIVDNLLETNATKAERIKKIDIADWICKELEREPQQFKAAMSGQERTLDEMIKANSAVGLLVEVLDLKVVEDAAMTPDSKFCFDHQSRKMQTKDKRVQRYHIYN